MSSARSSFSERVQKKDPPKVSSAHVIALVIIQILLSPIIIGHGVYLMLFTMKQFYTLEDGLWTIISYTAARKFGQHFTETYCTYVNMSTKRSHQRHIISGVIGLFATLNATWLTNIIISQTFIYGSCCGFCIGIIQTHLRLQENRVNEIVETILQPITLVFVPHSIQFLTDIYGIEQSQFILSAVILNIIPAYLITRNYQRLHTKSKSLRKFPTFNKLAVELTTLKSNKEINSNLNDEYDEYDEMEYEEIGIKNEGVGTENEGAYYSNLLLKCLPNIPEENEPEDDADDINDPKNRNNKGRFSLLIDHRKDNSSVNNYYQPDESMKNSSNDIKEVVQETPSCCVGLISNAWYSTRNIRECVQFFLFEQFIASIVRALGCLYFYPILICHCIFSFLSPIFLAIAPTIVFEHSKAAKSASWVDRDSVFLLSIIGFAWTFFFAGFPILRKFSDFKMRMTFLLGTLITGSSFFLGEKFTNSHIIGSCLLFGLGQGMISFTEVFAYKELTGEKVWEKLRGPMELCTAFLVILVYVTVRMFWDVRLMLKSAYWPYIFCAGLWISFYFLKELITRCMRLLSKKYGE